MPQGPGFRLRASGFRPAPVGGAIGVLGQGEGLTARHLADALQVETGSLKSWLGRLTKFGLVHTSGRAAGTRYFVAPAVLKESGLAPVNW